MNTYGIIILVIILLEFIVDNSVKLLNIKNLNDKLPSEFADEYDANTYSKSQEYTRYRTKFGFVKSVFNLILFLLFWQIGGFEYVNTITESLSEIFVIRGLYFFGIIMLAQQILS